MDHRLVLSINQVSPGRTCSTTCRYGDGGLESLLASAKDDFNFYYGILSRYYAPTELRGKTLKELDEMLQLHIKADGGLF